MNPNHLFRLRNGALLVLLATPYCALAQTPADAALGNWLNDTKDVKTLFFKCGDKVCGKIVWMKEPNHPNGQPKLDVNNPDPKRRNQPILNLVPLRDFAFNGTNAWEDGKIYNGENGREYDCKLTLVGKNELEVRGYVGVPMLGKSMTWTRVP